MNDYDYDAAWEAMESGEPGPVGDCLGCFRCRAGDHGSCHGCSCRCQGEWGDDTCPTTCATWWRREHRAGHDPKVKHKNGEEEW